MKKALVNTQVPVEHVISWVEEPSLMPIYGTYPNSCRVCEVVDVAFEVHPSLIWVDCMDDVIADQYWYDSSNATIKPIENEPAPEKEEDFEQPDMDGLESV
jgi:hypothetical protein